MSHFRINVVSNYTSLGYTTAVSLLFMPLLHDKLGAEFFGLVGVYVLLTNMLSILDFGLVSTVSRDCAVGRGDAQKSSTLIPVIRSAERAMFAIGAVAILVLVLISEPIVFRWMKLELANTEVAVMCFRLIVASIVIRWLAGLHRGVLNGFERQLVTSGVNAVSATLRFPVSYLLIVSVASSKAFYFELQLGIAVLEYVVLMLLSRQVTSTLVRNKLGDAESRALLRRTVGFSAAVASLMLLTMLFTQFDKLVLSKTLLMSDFGDFSLIASLATGVSTLGGPMAMALIPRLSNLNANSRAEDLFSVYLKSVRLMLILVVPAGAVVAFFAQQVLFSWTGSAELADRLAGTLAVYVIGNCLWVMAAFPGYLKFAKGDIRFLILYNLWSLLVYIPVTVYVAPVHGAMGVACMWMVMNAVMLVASHVFVHREFFDAGKRGMIMREVVASVVLAAVILFVLSKLLTWPSSRYMQGFQVAASVVFVAAAVFLVLRKGSIPMRSND